MDGSEVVALKGGLVVPARPVLLLLDLEERGFKVERVEDDTLNVQPYQQLTDEDVAAIRKWKSHLLALVDYVTNAESIQ